MHPVKSHTADMAPEIEISALLTLLRDDLGYRRIEQGISRLKRIRPTIEALEPAFQYSGVLLGLVAQWVDAGFDDPELLSRLLAKFPSPTRSGMPLLDYLHLRMAEGVL